jgi:hypothetical protein
MLRRWQIPMKALSSWSSQKLLSRFAFDVALLRRAPSHITHPQLSHGTKPGAVLLLHFFGYVHIQAQQSVARTVLP